MSDKKDIFVKIFAGDEIWQIFNKIERKNCENCCEIICGIYIFAKIRILRAENFAKTKEVSGRISPEGKYPP